MDFETPICIAYCCTCTVLGRKNFYSRELRVRKRHGTNPENEYGIAVRLLHYIYENQFLQTRLLVCNEILLSFAFQKKNHFYNQR